MAIFRRTAFARIGGRGGSPLEKPPEQRFADVAALAEAVDALRALVDAIRHPAKYAKYGARTPRGVLLYGPPGTGKTLLARALAGEAGVPFFSVCGADFVQMYVGVGAGRVRDLFRRARKAGRAVVFIDEIDALGGRRDGGGEERDQTLNALLTEMSGFKRDSGIVVVAATNRPDKLDPALLRPGRFDRQIEIGMPDRAGRHKILSVHAKNKPLGEDVDLSRVAADTVSFSGAKLETMLNEAAIYAARRDAGAICAEDIDRAFRTLLVGEERSGGMGDARERRITAYHEAGHALATLVLEPEGSLRRVSIIPSTRGMAGYSMAIPPERMLLTRAQVEARIVIALSGRAAEAAVFGEGDVTTGAGNDLAQATELASRMCREWGMDVQAGLSVRANGCEECISSTLAEQYARASALLEQNRAALDALANALLEREAVDGIEAAKIVENHRAIVERSA